MRLISLALFSVALCFGLEPDGDSVVLYPPPGAVLPGTTVTFTWDRAPTAVFYRFSLTGSTSGVIISGPTNGYSQTVTNIPCDGQVLTFSLNTYLTPAGSRTPFVATYQAPSNCGPDPRAVMLNPDPGRTLFSSSAIFRWSAPHGATGYWLDIGTARGIGNISAGFQLTTDRTVTNLPCNAQTIWLRLWTHTNSGYLDPVDYNYAASDSCTPPAYARFTSPVGRQLLPGRTTRFEWTAVPGATGYRLQLGTVPGGNSLYDAVHANTVAVAVSDPCFENVIYATLTTQIQNRVVGVEEVWFLPPQNCSGFARAFMISPRDSTVISGTPANFTWSPGVDAVGYWLDIGPVRGSGSYFAEAINSGTSVSVDGLPCDGSPLWVRLWTRTAHGYYRQPRDYTYRAGSVCGPIVQSTLTVPAAGATLTSTAQTFRWERVPAALDYWLDVGHSLGRGNLFAGTVRGTEKEVFGLPCTGQNVFVRLWTRFASGYLQPLDYRFPSTTNCNTEPRGTLIQSFNWNRLSNQNSTLSWNPGAGAQDYWLDIGTQYGLGDVLTIQTAQTTARIPELPHDIWTRYCAAQPNNSQCSSQVTLPLWVRLWTRRNGVWLPPIDYPFELRR